MKKLIVFLLLLILFPFVSYAQIWEGDGGQGIDEGLGFGGGSGGSIDWDDFTGDKCTVTFQSLDGSYSQSAVVPVGVPSSYVMQAISAPNKTGYDFGGWSYLNDYPTPITIPDNFIATQTYYAIYNPHLHNVTFMVDNTVYYVEQNVPYGTAIPLPTPPTYPVIPQDNILYEWAGLPDSMPDNDVTVTAVYGIGYWGMDINQATGEITYLYRAQNMLPVRVTSISANESQISNWNDQSTSWKSFCYEYFKPCMLKSNGTVDYYLDPTDQRYRADGVTLSDYNNTSYDGNAMVEIKKLYIKITEPETDIIRVLFSPTKVDSSFTAYAFVNDNGNEVDKVYYAMYIGSNVSGTVRSIWGGVKLTIAPKNLEASAQVNGAGWNIEYYSLRNYINLLTTMVMKTIDIGRIGFNAKYTTGDTTNSSNDSWGVNQDSFAVYPGGSSSTTHFKLFWIKDYFINEHLTRGLAYDVANSCWKYRNTPPYSFSDLSSYFSCVTDGLTFTTSTQGICYRVLSKMTVIDNLLLPYSEATPMPPYESFMPPYGRSVLGNLNGGSISGVYPYVSFGGHSLLLSTGGGIKPDNNIWLTNLGKGGIADWTNGVIKTSLVYVPTSN